MSTLPFPKKNNSINEEDHQESSISPENECDLSNNFFPQNIISNKLLSKKRFFKKRCKLSFLANNPGITHLG